MATTNTPSVLETKAVENDLTVAGQTSKKSGGSCNRGGQKVQASTVMYGFEGAKTEIGAVLGLKHERMKYKVIFDDFIDKFISSHHIVII